MSGVSCTEVDESPFSRIPLSGICSPAAVYAHGNRPSQQQQRPSDVKSASSLPNSRLSTSCIPLAMSSPTSDKLPSLLASRDIPSVIDNAPWSGLQNSYDLKDPHTSELVSLHPFVRLCLLMRVAATALQGRKRQRE